MRYLVKKAQVDIQQIQTLEDLTKQLQQAGVQVPDEFATFTPEQIVSWADAIGAQANDTDQVLNQIREFANVQRNLAIQQGSEMTAKTKAFNIKKAQLGIAPDDPDYIPDEGQFADYHEPDPFEDALLQEEKWATHSDLKDWLDQQADSATAYSEISPKIPEAYHESVKDVLQQYYETDLTDEEKLDIANKIFDVLPDENKILESNPEEGVIDATYKEIASFVQNVNDQIKKIAQKNKTNKFNLTKTAQHKGVVDNVFMYGPTETRIDPFLRQPISDYHIVERNKGFGLVVDDIWNIDWEVLWRQNIMDKYSRPYRDKDGNWTGGYIQKRFEVDKWIPDENNYQLKPGQLRKPYIAKERSTEARLEAMRAEGDRGYKPASFGNPYNWSKQASKKKS